MKYQDKVINVGDVFVLRDDEQDPFFHPVHVAILDLKTSTLTLTWYVQYEYGDIVDGLYKKRSFSPMIMDDYLDSFLNRYEPFKPSKQSPKVSEEVITIKNALDRMEI